MFIHYHALTAPLFLLIREKVYLHNDIVRSIFPWSYKLEIRIAITDFNGVGDI